MPSFATVKTLRMCLKLNTAGMQRRMEILVEWGFLLWKPAILGTILVLGCILITDGARFPPWPKVPWVCKGLLSRNPRKDRYFRTSFPSDESHYYRNESKTYAKTLRFPGFPGLQILLCSFNSFMDLFAFTSDKLFLLPKMFSTSWICALFQRAKMDDCCRGSLYWEWVENALTRNSISTRKRPNQKKSWSNKITKV